MKICEPCHNEHVPRCDLRHIGAGLGRCEACHRERVCIECPMISPAGVAEKQAAANRAFAQPPPAGSPKPAQQRRFVVVAVDGDEPARAEQVAALLRQMMGITAVEVVPGDARVVVRVAKAIVGGL